MGQQAASKLLEHHPNYRDWHRNLMERPAVQRIMQNVDISSQS